MRPTVKLWELYDITSSKRVFEKDWKKSWVPFYRAREIVKLSENWYVDNELFISEEMYKEYWEKYWLPEKNDIMVTWVGTIWICYLVKDNDKFYFKDGNILRFKNKWKDVNSRFVEYFFKTDLLKNQIQNFWSVVQTLTIQKAKEVEIPLPPIETQKAIVAKLDQIFSELDQTKSEIQKNLDNTDELWKSALNQAFQGDWEMKKLGDCVKINNWYVLTEFDENWKYACIKVWDMNLVENNPFITTSEHWINEYKENRIVEENSIIFPKRWAAIATNKKRLNKIPCYIDNNCMAISIKDNIHILPMFLFVFMQWFDLSTISNSAGIPLINNNDIWGVIIPVPPLSEQEKIVEHLDQVSKEVKALKSQYQSQLDNLEELKKSVLDKTFRWELG